MGQPIVVIETASAVNPGMVRFQTNRALTGMSHERYAASVEVRGDRPPDELARRMLAHGGVEAIHINGSVVTVDLTKGHDTAGLKEIIETLFIHYPATGTDDVADADQPTSDGELAEQAAAAPADSAPDPDHEPAQPVSAGEPADSPAAAAESSPPSAADATDATDAAGYADGATDPGEGADADSSSPGDDPAADEDPDPPPS